MVARTVAPAVLILLVQQVAFPAPVGVLVRGAIVGALSALIAVGMALIWRTNRIVNFAQADLGTAPAVIAALLITSTGLNWFLGLAIGLAASLVLGVTMELAIVRRFFRAPRLVLTVATVGLAQVLAGVALLLPRLWDDRALGTRVPPPFSLTFEVSPIVFSSADLIALVVAPVAMVALAILLRRTDAGIAVRAAAEDGDRAALLGVPVRRLQTVVWAAATALAFTATFLRTGILGLPIGPALSFGLLLRSLAALTLGGMTNLPAVALSAIALGVLELGVGWSASSPLLLDPILAAVILAALLLRRRGTSRAETVEASTWQVAEEVRPLRRELSTAHRVRATRAGVFVILAAAAAVLPHLLTADRSLKASAVLVYAVLGLSLVVLTGWAGQVSLGQVAFFAIGAAVGGVATADWGLDLSLAVLVAAAAGGAAAALVGVPSLRLRGLFPAVSTFGFALATTSWLLNRRFFEWVPSGRIERPDLFGRVDIDSPTRIYYVALAGAVVAFLAVRGIRHSRVGRVLIALRENERAAQSYGVSPARAKLAAFALSGGIAAYAGALFVHHQQAFGQGPYEAGQNLAVFTMVVVGGIGSAAGAVLGAIWLRGIQWFLPVEWQFLVSGAGVVLLLMVLPGGLAGLLFNLRDRAVRRLAGTQSPDETTRTPAETPEPALSVSEP